MRCYYHGKCNGCDPKKGATKGVGFGVYKPNSEEYVEFKNLAYKVINTNKL